MNENELPKDFYECFWYRMFTSFQLNLYQK